MFHIHLENTESIRHNFSLRHIIPQKLLMINKTYNLFYLVLLVSFKQIICPNVDYSSKSNGMRNILSELDKMSTSLNNLESAHGKLITLLRNTATSNGFKNRSPEDLKKNGYTCTEGIGWHKLNTLNLTWNDARKSCRKDDAYLAVINSEAEAETLKNLLLENCQFSAYIGIHNQFKEDEWVTVFGDPLTEAGYNRWSVGPPKISEANCGVLFEDGKLLGIPCHVERSYFCEIPGIPKC